MKAMTNPAQVATRALATTLAALIIAPFASAQTSDADAFRRLQEENAALRRQLAEAQGRAAPVAQPAPTATAAPRTTTSGPAPATAMTDSSAASESITVLTPFEVQSDK